MTDFQFSDALKDIGQIITVLDVSGKVLYVNRVVPGIDISKFIGSQIYRWLPENTSKIIKKNLKEIIITKSELEFEDEIIDPTGITHYYANRMTPIIRDNVVDGVTIVTNETTALKKLKSQLARSQDIAALSLNTLEIGIWDWDIRTRTVEMDDMSYKIFGWQRAEFDNSIDTFLNEIFHPEDVEALLLQSRFGPNSKFGTGDKDSSENQLVQGGKIRFIRGYDKEVRWIKYRAKSFFNEDDELIRTLVSVGMLLII